MGYEVKRGENGNPSVPVGGKGGDAAVAEHALRQIEIAAKGFAKRHHDSALARKAVLLAVAIIVEHEEGIDHQSAGGGEPPHFGGERSCLHVVGAHDGDEAEEDPHEEVAQSAVAEHGGIEEGEDHASRSESNDIVYP